MKWLWAMFLVLAAALRGAGAVTEGIASLSITNVADVLLAADALTNAPGTERDALQVRAVVRWTNDAAFSANRTTEYHLQILSGNTPVGLITESGQPGTVYRFTNSVSVPGTFGGNSVASRTNVFSLRPANRLAPLTDYHVRLELLVGGVSRNNLSNTPPRQFWHFTNVVSGDAGLNVLGAIESSEWVKTYAVDTAPGEDLFEVTNTFRLLRFDDFQAARTVGSIPVRIGWQLRDTNGVLIPTVPSSTNFVVPVFNYDNPATPLEPRDRTLGQLIAFRPRQQLDSVSNRYRLVLTLSVTNLPGQPAEVFPGATTPNTQLDHFNGTLRFGDVTATWTNVAGAPQGQLAPFGADYVNVQLDGRATLDAAPVRVVDLAGPRLFRLRANGEASLASGTLSVPSPLSGDTFTNGNVRIRRGLVELGPDGARGDLRFYLPTGFGLSTNYGATRRLDAHIQFFGVGLDTNLEPRTNLVLATTFVANQESKPLWIVGERLVWSRSLHRFTITPSSVLPAIWTRASDDAILRAASNSLAHPSMAAKRANDGYYTRVEGFDQGITLTANSQHLAQLTYLATLANGSFQPHFPYGPTVTWTNGGRIDVANNSVTAGTNSRLEGVLNLVQSYPGECLGCGSAPRTNSLSVTPSNRVLNFTRDGGLVAVHQPTLPAASLRWGYSDTTAAYAHQASQVTSLAFHMPGHFLRATDDPSDGENAPGVLLLTGVAATNLAVIERPLTPAYENVGRADYAGVNVRSAANDQSVGQDVITGVPFGFRRTSRSKYYVRAAGVNGIHEASPGTFDTSLTLAGYPFTFDRYGASYRDSREVETRTDGSVRVPYPANIALPFRELRLRCSGGLLSAELATGGTYRHLEYWNADILPQTMSFVGPVAAECDPTETYLVVGVQAHASLVSKPLSGTLGFFPNGSLIPPAFNLPGVDSRFELPSRVEFSGPEGSGNWVLTPVAPAYFTTNDYANASRGYINLAGKLNVPFFEDLKVHLHAEARTNGGEAAAIELAGGWPGAGLPNRYGWEVGGEHYFNAADFDSVNRGFPAGVNLAAYHQSGTVTNRARAQREWLEIVDLDYPLAWDPILRQFRSWRTVTSSLLLLTAAHQVSYLDPRQAILDVGARYEGLPVVSLTHLLADENGPGAGAASAVREAVGLTSFQGITNGLVAADALLSDLPAALTEQLMQAAVDPVVDALMAELNARWAEYRDLPPSQRAGYRTAAMETVTNYFLGGVDVPRTVERSLLYLGVPGLGGQLFPVLATDTARMAEGMERVAGSFNGGATGAEIIRQLVSRTAPEMAASVAGPEVEAALAQNASSFQQLQRLVGNAQAAVASVNNGLAAATSEWADELEAAWNGAAASLRFAASSAASVVAADLGGYNYRVDDPFAGEGSANVRARIRSEIASRLMAEPILAQVRTSAKQRLFDPNANFRSAGNSLLALYNTVARDLISRSLVQVDNNFIPALDTLADYFEISRLQGHAEIQDDSLRQLRIDGRFKLKVPEDMTFNAYLEIKELNSENTPEECLYAGGVATEVKFGATDTELDWISDGLRADVGTKITLVEGHPRGIAGSLQTSGPIEFAGFVIKQVGFALAFGENENYIAANARVRLGQSSEIAGGLFFGRACDIDPLVIAVASVSPYLLASVNPKQIFGEPPFTGGFVYAEGMFPVFSLGCLLEVRLIAGAGGWYFKEGPKFGGIIKAGVSGTVVCVLTASGDITMIGSRNEDAMTFVGMAHVEGCFGIWPLEICIDGSTSVSYVEGREWDADEP